MLLREKAQSIVKRQRDVQEWNSWNEGLRERQSTYSDTLHQYYSP
jgi:hypothetical protein